jgi:AcrR family transcriptional regulator
MLRERTTHQTTHHTAAERREAVIIAATTEFAAKGLHGTSTEDIAARAGISQPYLFRLFGTKKDLFLATVDRVCDHIVAAFEQAVAEGEGDLLHRMGLAYTTLMRNREDLLVLLHSFAAASDHDVQAKARQRMAQIIQLAQQQSGASDEQIRTFLAHGMLITVIAALDAPDLLGFPDWDAFIRDCKTPGFPPSPAEQIAP